MPLKKGKGNVASNISELHKGPRFAANEAKFGKAKANKIAIAAAYSAAGEGKEKVSHHHLSEHMKGGR